MSKASTISKLVFVYNANSGLQSGINDLVHKTIKPTTYPCRLCAVTYAGPIKKPKWNKFIKDLGIKCEFLYKNEFEKKYKTKKYKYPLVLEQKKSGISVLIGNKEFESVTNLNSLTKLINKKLEPAT